MAVPTSFAESNHILDLPEGMSQDDCFSLCVLKGETREGIPFVISCWKLTQVELDEVNRTGRIWLGICGRTMAPAFVAGIKPNIEVEAHS